MIKRILALLLAGVMVLAFCSCGNNGEQDAFEIYVSVGAEPSTIDPALLFSANDYTVVGHLFEGLYKYEGNGTDEVVLVPGQAESVEISEDGKTYTFILRDDAMWSDGKEVTADDFLYSWQRVVAPETASMSSYFLTPVEGAADIIAGRADKSTLGVRVIDKKTFEVKLCNPCSYFLDNTAATILAPVRRDIIEEYGDQWTFEPETYISNGPFVLDKWEHVSRIRMTKSPTYYDRDNIELDAVNFMLIDDGNSIYSAFLSKQLNYCASLPEGLRKESEQNSINLTEELTELHICFQTQKYPFDDARVRKALSLVINRRYIAEQILHNQVAPACGFIPNGVKGNPNLKGDFRDNGKSFFAITDEDYRNDCELARRLMTEAGYPDGKGFPSIELLSVSASGLSEALQNMWKEELGITVNLAVMEQNMLYSTLSKGDFNMAIDGWSADFNDPVNFLYVLKSGNPSNNSFYSNPSYDALILRSEEVVDYDERFDCLYKAEEMLMEDAVIAPLYFKKARWETQGIKGVSVSNTGMAIFTYAKPE